MTLSIDTTAAVDLLRRDQPLVRRRFEAVVESGRRMVISTVVLHELSYGAARSDRPATKLSDINDLLTRVEVAPFEAGDAHVSGYIRAELDRQPLALPDLLIGAQAVAREWTVVTSNIRHFGRISGLPLIDWRSSEEPLSLDEIEARSQARARD